jgi:hypothetical protein
LGEISGDDIVNERITFIVAALVGELSASVFVYLIAPSGPLVATFPGLLNYAGEHGSVALIVWVAIWTIAWLTIGPRIIRQRQNLSTKIRLLVGLGLAGLVIDNTVSIFQQYFNAPDMTSNWWSRGAFLGIVERTCVYAVSFAGVVLLSYLISLTRKPTETPPPPFGRE